MQAVGENIQNGKKKKQRAVADKLDAYSMDEWAKFAALNRIRIRDLNKNDNKKIFSLYSKDDIQKYISDPQKYERQLRKAVIYLYGASPHFRRLIQYFVGLTDFSYIVSPYKIDPNTTNKKTINRNYRKVLNMLSSMNIKTQFPKMLGVCLREDVYYCTMWVTADNITFQQLPSDFCAVSSVEGNVLNVSFDFSYFDSRQPLLDYYPEEFRNKYEQYRKNFMTRWIELDSPTSFAIKCNNDILEYAMPPFAGILREVYDLEDYKQLKMSKTALENYAMLDMRLPMDDNGEWLLDYKKAKEFWMNLDSVLPEEVGSILSPMPINKISFEKSNTGDTNTIADAEENLFTSAGVSSLLFNNEKASANSLALSIKVDQEITYGIVKSIEDALNRYLHSLSYGKSFEVNFLNVSAFNRKEIGDQYLKAAQYGLPTVLLYGVSQGLSQSEFDSMAFLENDVLQLKDKLVPLMSSATMSTASTDSEAPTEEGGRPPMSGEELTDSGEQTSEDSSDWG